MSEQVPVDPHIIEALLRGACPERAEELGSFWQKFEPKFAVKSDDRGIPISARAGKVTWMHKTLAHEWVVTFAGFKSIAAYGPHVQLGWLTGELTARSLGEDSGLAEAEAELHNLLYFAKLIRQVKTLDDLDWPNDVPRPELTRELLSRVEDQACYDVACLATAATFLHELRHVQFSKEDNAPSDRLDEERMCDEFSREILLNRVETHCQSTGEDTVLVTSKRVIGLATAAFSIAEAEAPTMAAAIENSHPPIKDRFHHLVMRSDAPEQANCWLYLACLLIALLQRKQRLPQVVKFSSEKDLCGKLVQLL